MGCWLLSLQLCSKEIDLPAALSWQSCWLWQLLWDLHVGCRSSWHISSISWTTQRKNMVLEKWNWETGTTPIVTPLSSSVPLRVHDLGTPVIWFIVDIACKRVTLNSLYSIFQDCMGLSMSLLFSWNCLLGNLEQQEPSTLQGKDQSPQMAADHRSPAKTLGDKWSHAKILENTDSAVQAIWQLSSISYPSFSFFHDQV